MEIDLGKRLFVSSSCTQCQVERSLVADYGVDDVISVLSRWANTARDE
jgi:hypothetical protein